MSDLIDVPAARTELKLSQEQLAERLGVDQSTVSLWEQGKHKPSGPARRLIARMLDEHRSGENEHAA